MEQEPKIEAEIDASIKQDREARQRATEAQELKIEDKLWLIREAWNRANQATELLEDNEDKELSVEDALTVKQYAEGCIAAIDKYIALKQTEEK